MDTQNAIQNNILAAVDQIVSQRIDALKLNKTVVGIIHSNTGTKNNKNQYRIKYESGFFEAVTQNEGDVYLPNTAVYILIPQGDFSQEKIIIGRASSLKSIQDSKVIASAINNYAILGKNLISPVIEDDQFGVYSYHNPEEEETDPNSIKHRLNFIYQKDYLDNKIVIDNDNLSLLMKDASALMMRANFQTNLTNEQRKAGSGKYGLIFNFVFKNETNDFGNTQGEFFYKFAKDIKVKRLKNQILTLRMYDAEIENALNITNFNDQNSKYNFERVLENNLEKIKNLRNILQKNHPFIFIKYQTDIKNYIEMLNKDLLIAKEPKNLYITWKRNYPNFNTIASSVTDDAFLTLSDYDEELKSYLLQSDSSLNNLKNLILLNKNSELIIDNKILTNNIADNESIVIIDSYNKMLEKIKKASSIAKARTFYNDWEIITKENLFKTCIENLKNAQTEKSKSKKCASLLTQAQTNINNFLMALEKKTILQRQTDILNFLATQEDYNNSNVIKLYDIIETLQTQEIKNFINKVAISQKYIIKDYINMLQDMLNFQWDYSAKAKDLNYTNFCNILKNWENTTQRVIFNKIASYVSNDVSFNLETYDNTIRNQIEKNIKDVKTLQAFIDENGFLDSQILEIQELEKTYKNDNPTEYNSAIQRLFSGYLYMLEDIKNYWKTKNVNENLNIQDILTDIKNIYNDWMNESLIEKPEKSISYFLDSDSMIGNPYAFSSWVEQYAIFDMDFSNFLRLDSVLLFKEGFIEDAEKEQLWPLDPLTGQGAAKPDIYVKNLELYALEPLNSDNKEYSLKIEAPVTGNILSSNDIQNIENFDDSQINEFLKYIEEKNNNVGYTELKNHLDQIRQNFKPSETNTVFHNCLTNLLENLEDNLDNNNSKNDKLTEKITFSDVKQELIKREIELKTNIKEVTFQAVFSKQGIEDLSENTKVRYYWFKQDKNIVNTSSIGYNSYGGVGWKILQGKENDTSPNRFFSTTFEENTAYENKYKCIAIYVGEENIDELILKTEFIVYNKSQQNHLVILETDSGMVDYYSGNGAPVITCYIGTLDSKKEYVDNDEGYSFYWAITDSNNQTVFLNNLKTMDINNLSINNTNAYFQQQSLLAGIEYFNGNEQIFNDSLKNSITRIKYPIGNLKPNEIITFECYVEKEENGVSYNFGKGTLKLNNFGKTEINTTRIQIENGDQVFQYDEYGNAPNDEKNKDPKEILPLRAKLIDPNNNEISSSSFVTKWYFNLENSMVQCADESALLIDPVTQKKNLFEGNECIFNISPFYDYNSLNNQISCKIIYQGEIYYKDTNFTFTKVGNTGTNGTDIVAKISSNYDSTILDTQPLILYVNNANSSNPKAFLNTSFTSEGSFPFSLTNGVRDGKLKASLYQKSQEIVPTNIKWNLAGNLKNNKNDKGKNFILSDKTNLSWGWNFKEEVKNNNVSKIPIEKNNPYRLQNIKAEITYENKKYYAFFPLPLIEYKGNVTSVVTRRIAIEKTTYLKEILYNADGRNPLYNQNQGLKIINLPVNVKVTFTAKGGILQANNGQYLENAPCFKLLKEKNSAQKDAVNKIEIITNKDLDSAMVYVLPDDEYTGNTCNNYIQATITKNDASKALIATIYSPINMILNTYGLASLNAWDGNSVVVNNEDNYVMAPQIGAGEKNEEDNTFTGILMGTQKIGSNVTSEIGLFGYRDGYQSIFLDAKTGNAIFGLPTDKTVFERDQKGNVTNKQHERFFEGRIELKPGGLSKIGGWVLGERALFYTDAQEAGLIEQQKFKKDYIPDRTGYITAYSPQTSRYRKGHEKDIKRENTGILLYAGNYPYISIKGKPLKIKDNGEDKDFISDDETSSLKDGDALEIQIDPNTPTLFTIFRHNGSDRKNSDKTMRYEKDSRTFLAGINSRGELIANALQSELGGNKDSVTRFATTYISAFGASANKQQYVGFITEAEKVTIGKFFTDFKPKQKNNRITETTTLYISGSNNGESNEYQRSLKIYGNSFDFCFTPKDEKNFPLTGKDSDNKVHLTQDDCWLRLGYKSGDWYPLIRLRNGAVKDKEGNVLWNYFRGNNPLNIAAGRKNDRQELRVEAKSMGFYSTGNIALYRSERTDLDDADHLKAKGGWLRMRDNYLELRYPNQYGSTVGLMISNKINNFSDFGVLGNLYIRSLKGEILLETHNQSSHPEGDTTSNFGLIRLNAGKKIILNVRDNADDNSTPHILIKAPSHADRWGGMTNSSNSIVLETGDTYLRLNGNNKASLNAKSTPFHLQVADHAGMYVTLEHKQRQVDYITRDFYEPYFNVIMTQRINGGLIVKDKVPGEGADFGLMVEKMAEIGRGLSVYGGLTMHPFIKDPQNGRGFISIPDVTQLLFQDEFRLTNRWIIGAGSSLKDILAAIADNINDIHDKIGDIYSRIDNLDSRINYYERHGVVADLNITLPEGGDAWWRIL